MGKFKIVLFNPRFIGLYVKENIFKALITLVIAILVVLIPTYVELGVKDKVSSEFQNFIIEVTANEKIKNTYISNGVLYTENEYEFDAYYFNILIGKEVDITNIETMYTNKLLFDTDSIKFYISNVEFYSITYNELNLLNFDFSLIESYDISSVNQYVNIFNDLFNENKIVISTTFAFVYTFELIFVVFMSALTMTVISYIFSNKNNNHMPFGFRYKNALNCQYIYLVFILLSSLYRVEALQFIGNFAMAFYVVIAMNSIIMKRKEQ